MIVILGSEDIHTQAIARSIEALGEEAWIFDSRQYPWHVKLTHNTHEPLDGQFHILSGPWKGRSIPIDSIRAVYWYCYNGIQEPSPQQAADANPRTVAAMWNNYLNSFLKLWGESSKEESAPGTPRRCKWINPPHAIEAHQFKGLQLRQVAHLGLHIPDTRFSNSAKEVREFLAAHGGRLIMKGNQGSGVPQVITEENQERFLSSNLQYHPGQFQQFIEGMDIRIHMVGDRCFPTEIHTDTACYKTDPNLKIVPFTCPDDIVEQCRQICQTLGYHLAGLDFRRDAEGRYWFLEANPSPQFMIFDERAWDGSIGNAVSQDLCSTG